MSNKNIYRPQSKFQYSSYLYIIPAFVFYILFVLFPLGDTLYTSFTEWNGISEKKWVGLQQYIDNLNNKKITSSIVHSFILIIFYSFLPIVIGLIIAGIMIRVKIYGLTFYRAILFLPQILSMIVVGVSWRWIYAPKGPLNSGLDFFGLEDVSRAWLGSFDYALPFVGLIGTWVMFGFTMVLFIAGVQKIPSELYDAAKVDGANSWQVFSKITVPMLYPFISLALLFRSIDAFKTFDIIYVLTSGGPGVLTRTLNLYAFKHGIEFLSMGYAGSIAIVMLIITIVVAQIFLRKNKLLQPKDTFK